MKINLSAETVEYLIKHDCELASAENKEEYEAMERMTEELSGPRDEKGRIELSPEVFARTIAALDWYCSAYWNEQR